MTVGRNPTFTKIRKVINPTPKEYNHLDKSFATINQDIESKCNEEEREGNLNIHTEDPEERLDDNEETTADFNFETAEDAEVDNSGGRK